MNQKTTAHRVGRRIVFAMLLAALCGTAQAQYVATMPAPVGLKEIFEQAWARQPEASALALRQDALAAQQRAAQAYTPEPVIVEISAKSDAWARNQGAAEREYGIVVPLWLPGERRIAATLADAQRQAFDRQIAATRLQLAAQVRQLWWAWQRARIEQALCATQLAHAHKIAADVARRVKAGDLARADQYQAESAVAKAQFLLAQADAALVVVFEQMRAIVGQPIPGNEPLASPEPEPQDNIPPSHIALQALASREEVATHAAQLAATRTRANPELYVAAGQDRSAAGEAWSSKLVVGLRLPLGGAKQEAAIAQAKADAAQARAEIALQRDQLQAEWEAARAKAGAMRTAWQACERRAELSRELRRVFEKSYELGETDLPTRLRIEAEAVEAEREAARARIDLSAAISAWRQAAGLLPK